MASTGPSTSLARLILAAGVPDLVPPLAHRPRAPARDQGRADRRLESPQLPRPVRDRRDPALATADAVRGQGRALRAPLAGMDPLPRRRIPDPPRPVRRDRDGDRAARAGARRHGLHLPRGNPNPLGLAGDPRSAASAAWRSRPAPRWSRSRCTAPSTCAAAGGSARARSSSASARPMTLPAHRASVARRSPPPSPPGSGRTSSSSGSGSAACRRFARRR